MEWVDPKSMTSSRPVRTRIVVISMADAGERRSRFEARARTAPVAWSFYAAHTSLHPSLRYDEVGAIVAKGRPLRAGEIGCYSSHYAAWTDLQSSDADQYVVLEDDVIVDWTFVGKLAQVDLAAMGINYLRLYYKFPARAALVKENFIDRARSIVELAGNAYGTQGYAITKAGAKVFLDHCRIVCSRSMMRWIAPGYMASRIWRCSRSRCSRNPPARPSATPGSKPLSCPST
jgi:glycosyl transferase family 25